MNETLLAHDALQALVDSTWTTARSPRSTEYFHSAADCIQENAALFFGSALDRRLSKKQVISVFHWIDVMLKYDGCSLRYDDRVILASQILAHAANPKTVTSRGFNTSAACALEYLLYKDKPEVAAEMIGALALTGICYSPLNRLLHLGRNNRLPIYNADMAVSPGGTRRSYASQFLQTIITNDILTAEIPSARYLIANVDEEADLLGLTGKEIAKRRPRGDGRTAELLLVDDRCVDEFSGVDMHAFAKEAQAFFGREVLQFTPTIDALARVLDKQQEQIILPMVVANEIRYLVVKALDLKSLAVYVWSPIWSDHTMLFQTN